MYLIMFLWSILCFGVLFCVFVPVSLLCFLFLCADVSIQTSAMKGGNSRGKEPMIDVDDPSPRSKRTRFPTGVYDTNKFRSYAAF